MMVRPPLSLARREEVQVSLSLETSSTGTSFSRCLTFSGGMRIERLMIVGLKRRRFSRKLLTRLAIRSSKRKRKSKC